jgi:site-specific DNA recombinase
VSAVAAANAAIYLRVSSARQAVSKDADRAAAGTLDGSRQETSLDTQEAACRALAAERGYNVLAGHVYREVYSGATLHDRPALAELRAAVARREVSALICYDLDRLTRKQTHIAILAEECENAKVAMHFAQGGDFEVSATGTFLRQARAFAGELEREKLIERTTRGRAARARAGKPLPGWKPPYGYCWRDDGHDPRSGRRLRLALVPDPLTAPTAAAIFRAVAGGTTLNALAIDLTTTRVPTPTGRSHEWYPSTLRTIITNSAYCGRPSAFRHKVSKTAAGKATHRMRPKDETVALPEGTVPALVEPQIWEQCQQRLVRNRAAAIRNNRDPEATLLRGGFVRCGSCGRGMRAHRARRASGDVHEYTCNRSGVRPTSCDGGAMKASELDDAVWRKITDILTDPATIQTALDRLQGDDTAAGEVADIERQLSALDRQRRNLIGNLGLLDPGDAVLVRAQLGQLAEQRSALEARQAVQFEQTELRQAARVQIDQLAAGFVTVTYNLGQLTYGEKRDVLEALGVTVRLWRQGSAPRWTLETTFTLDAGDTPHIADTRG